MIKAQSTMKKILLFMLPVMALCIASCEKNNGGELSGDDVIEFEDPNFLKALLYVQEIPICDPETDDYAGDYHLIDVDANKDGKITVNEAKKARILALVDYNNEKSFNIKSIPEIKYFTALEYLICGYNQLTSLDISNNTALEYLDCSLNQITSLDLSSNTTLKNLRCYYNDLTSLDLSKNSELRILGCGANPITTLDLSKNRKLQSFSPFGTAKVSGDDVEFSDLCPLESLILYKGHNIREEDMRYLKLAYPDLEITYVE